MKFRYNIFLIFLASIAAAGVAHASVVVGYEGESAGVENTAATLFLSGMEVFNGLAVQTYHMPIAQAFSNVAHPTTLIAFSYNGAHILPADPYGGVSGSRNYIVGHYKAMRKASIVPLLGPIQGAVNESAAWTIMLVGFGSLGVAMRVCHRQRCQTNRSRLRRNQRWSAAFLGFCVSSSYQGSEILTHQAL